MMKRTARGFTLIELMIVVVILGVLAAFAIPNFIAMQDRAKEGSLKSNMHTFQMAAEDYGVLHDGTYCDVASGVVSLVPGGNGNFRNTFTRLTGIGVAWEDRASFAAAASTIPGITSYADSSSGLTYNIKGHGRSGSLTIILSPGH